MMAGASSGTSTGRLLVRKRGLRAEYEETCSHMDRAVRARMAAATGAVRAKESGSSPMEMNQSKLDTRPKRRFGTNRCFVVAHTIVPAASRALNEKAAIIACHGYLANPYPAMASVD